MVVDAKHGLFTGMACLLAAGGLAQATTDMNPMERYGVLTLLSAVILGIGGAALKIVPKILMQLDRSIVDNTAAVRELANSISTLVSQNQEAHRTYASERDRAVAEVKEAVAHAERRILRELEGRHHHEE